MNTDESAPTLRELLTQKTLRAIQYHFGLNVETEIKRAENECLKAADLGSRSVEIEFIFREVASYVVEHLSKEGLKTVYKPDSSKVSVYW